MIRKIGAERYPELIRFAEENRCGKVYPLSIAQKTQAGDVFADSEGDFRSVLFWHCSGFAFLAGEAQEAFLDDVFALLTDQSRRNPRRFVLLTDDRQAEQFLFSKGGVGRQRRALFAYGQKPPPAASLPVGYEWREMDGELSARIQGRVVPALFWQRPEDFLERGKGFCIVRGGDIAAWRFRRRSAAGKSILEWKPIPLINALGWPRLRREKWSSMRWSREKSLCGRAIAPISPRANWRKNWAFPKYRNAPS